MKESGAKRGMSEGRAKAMASATVNKERMRSGEGKTTSGGPTQGKSVSQRGGQKSSGATSGEDTNDDLYQEAKRRGIEGRSTMSKQQLLSWRPHKQAVTST
ncbi:plasmid stabilization protein [Streptomyces sp. NPDC057939]|uniref:plasmid stabilization protein n=1 Tax=Streptomyces sp. NPDC057939 TaxID=3346284 RepID=UPI0036E87E51